MKNVTQLSENLNHGLDKLSDWLIRNKLQHHPTKTKVMYIGSKHYPKTLICDHIIMINNQLVPLVKSFTCLGVNLDETLEWSEHIEMIFKKVAAGIGTIQLTLKRIKSFIPACKLQTVYCALIQPYFDYCSLLWGFVTNNIKINFRNLKTEQREQLLVIC